MSKYLICVPSGTSFNGTTISQNPARAPCGTYEGVNHVPAVIEHAAPGTVHFDNADQLFAYGFVIVMVFFAIGSTVGAVLSLIRRG